MQLRFYPSAKSPFQQLRGDGLAHLLQRLAAARRAAQAYLEEVSRDFAGQAELALAALQQVQAQPAVPVDDDKEEAAPLLSPEEALQADVLEVAPQMDVLTEEVTAQPVVQQGPLLWLGGGSNMLQWLGLAFIFLLADQFTKILIVGYYHLGDSTYVTSFFNVVRVHNTGAAFSFLAGASGWQRWFFVGLGFVATGFIVYMLREHGGQKRFAWALSLILGGAIGNVLDRLIHGYVIDFLDFH